MVKRVMLVIVVTLLVLAGCSTFTHSPMEPPCSPVESKLEPEGTLQGNSTSPIPEPVEVAFGDANLERVIRDIIDKPQGSIYEMDLEGVTVLTAHGRNITDLMGIEHCRNLKYVYLSGNMITDLSPLSQLKGGQVNVTDEYGHDLYSYTVLHISLAYNLITDITPLSSLTEPDELALVLSGNQISNLSPLNGLTNMTCLYLHSNQISDISALAKLTNLSLLELWGNEIVDVSPLAELNNLTWLELERNNIVDPSPLAGLSNLTVLNLRDNQIVDALSLDALPETTEVLLEGNPITE